MQTKFFSRKSQLPISLNLQTSDNLISLFMLMGLFVIFNCGNSDNPVVTYPDINREEKIPSDIAKRGPDTDQYPPILHSTSFEEPIPLPSSVNTAGAEDSPFILPDGNTLFFFSLRMYEYPLKNRFRMK